MPRIPPALIRQARRIDVHVACLLPICRDILSAQNELRWLRQHAFENVSNDASDSRKRMILDSYVSRRSKGEPLQYILGTEYFGNLEIKCRPGVLIPRQETAASVSHLARMIAKKYANTASHKLTVLDLCTGSGCIPLLFHHELSNQTALKLQDLRIIGVDISLTALALARENHAVQLRDLSEEGGAETWRKRALHQLTFIQADILKQKSSLSQQPPSLIEALSALDNRSPPRFDILICNPPYISSKAFRHTTSPSVRRFEPRLALVPPTSQTTSSPSDGDLFYPQLLRIAEKLHSRVLLFEVADMAQATRVATSVIDQGIWDGVEIWRDDPSALFRASETLDISGRTVAVLGEGHGRSVVAYRSRVLPTVH